MRQTIFVLCFAWLSLSAAAPAADKKKAEPGEHVSSPTPELSDAEKEQFLAKASIVKIKSTSKGVTHSQRATLSDGKITHDAHFQFVDIYKPEFRSEIGVEKDFKDTYKFNIAAYKLARMLGITTVPVSVDRVIDDKPAASTWWVDNVLMDEETRQQKKTNPPDLQRWADEIFVIRVFDQLIYNIDRNLGNLIITKSWDLMMIDHTRAFRLAHTLLKPEDLSVPGPRCERTLLENLRKLSPAAVSKALAPWCTQPEIDALMARRDVIVKFMDEQVKDKGKEAVLYDLAKPYNILRLSVSDR